MRDELVQRPLRPGMDEAIFNFAAGRIEELREGNIQGFGELASAMRSTYGDLGIHADAPLGDIATAMVLLWAATYDLTGRAKDDLELAHRLCTDVYGRAADPLVRARAATTFADVVQRLFDRTGELDLVRDGIALLRDAVDDVAPECPDARPFLVIGVANLLEVLAESSGSGDDVSEALRSAQDAVSGVTDPDVARVFNGSVASLHLRRFRFLRDPADVHEAVRLCRGVLAETPASHHEWSTRANRLAGALIELYQLTDDASALREADDVLSRAQARTDLGSQLGVIITVNRAAVRRRTGVADGQDLDQAIDDLRAAIDQLEVGGDALVECQIALGDTLATRFERSGSVADLRASVTQALVAAEAAVALSVDREVSSWQSAGARARRLADLVAEHERDGFLEVAASSFTTMVDRVYELLRVSGVVYGERWLRDVFGAGTAAAEAYVQLRRDRDALFALSHGRDLRRQLRAQGSQPEPLSGGDRRSPVIHIAAAAACGFALVDDNGSLIARLLPELTLDALTNHANQFYAALDACRRNERSGFTDMRSVLSWLWRSAMAPAVDVLPQRPDHTVTLAPYGLLQLLPLHAACWPDPGSDAGWSHACDVIECVYYVSTSSSSGPQHDRDAVPLIIGAPATDAPVSPLPGADTEANAIAQLAHATVVEPTDATATHVMEALTGASYFHFAGHGQATAPLRADSPVDERKGCLILAGPDRLWDVDVARLDLRSLSLVTLSACETGRVDATMPDEGLSLGNAFLDAGADAVLASLWSVPDGSTAALITDFATRWIAQGRTAGQALREAQRAISRSGHRNSKGPERDLALLGHEGIRTSHEPRGDETYGHPYHWAAFTLHGTADTRWTSSPAATSGG